MAYAFNDDKSKFDLDTLAGNMATIETSPVISNHSIGEYILYDDILYEVISPIATGESLVLGTNVSSVNIGDQLKSLQDFMASMLVVEHLTTNVSLIDTSSTNWRLESYKAGYTAITYVWGYSFSTHVLAASENRELRNGYFSASGYAKTTDITSPTEVHFWADVVWMKNEV